MEEVISLLRGFMGRYLKKQMLKTSVPPGTLIFTGEQEVNSPVISIYSYNENCFDKWENCQLDLLNTFIREEKITWINITGLHDVGLIEKIGREFQIHSLTLEDILHTNQRAKVEEFESYFFITLPMLQYDSKSQEIQAEQVSVIFLDNIVISFQERQGDVFDKIRNRIASATGRIRRMKADYLCYSLIDAIVDHYFILLETVGNKIEELEDRLIESSDKNLLSCIHAVKREVIFLRKSIWPMRDLVNVLRNTDSPLIQKSLQIFLRDLSDHVAHITEIVQTFREIVADLVDIYLNNVSNKMNEVMKVLTIFAAIFIPLTFLAGVYGMNFEFMPELSWKISYPLWWVFSICIILFMLWFFKRKKWL